MDRRIIKESPINAFLEMSILKHEGVRVFEEFGKSYEDEQYALVELVKSRVIESMKDWIAKQHHEAMCEYHDNKQLAHDPHRYYGVSPSDF